MKEPKPETSKQSNMLWLALSRWDNEGGARRHLPLAHSSGPRLQHVIKPSVSFAAKKRAIPIKPVIEASVSTVQSKPE